MTNEYRPTAYLGDGVYARFDGYQIWLKTHALHEIALDPYVLKALNKFNAEIEHNLEMIKEGDAIAQAEADQEVADEEAYREQGFDTEEESFYD